MEYVKQQLGVFLKQNIPEASLSSIDDVVLGYTVEVLSDVGVGHSDDSSFDVDQFCEMISAYVPEFAEIDSTTVCEWLFELASSMKEYREPSPLPSSDRKEGHAHESTTQSHILFDKLPESAPSLESDEPRLETEGRSSLGVCDTPQNESRQSVESVSSASSNSRQLVENFAIDEEQLSLLVEMFPEASKDVINKTLCSCGGDLDAAIESLLEGNSEQCSAERLKQDKTSGENDESTTTGKAKTKVLETDASLKNFVLSRYEYVDTHEDKRVHQPLLPKQEPEKKIRYRDNHVVSTKGERFSVLTKKDQEGEDMKKTYVSIKPLKKYRFH